MAAMLNKEYLVMHSGMALIESSALKASKNYHELGSSYGTILAGRNSDMLIRRGLLTAKTWFEER